MDGKLLSWNLDKVLLQAEEQQTSLGLICHH